MSEDEQTGMTDEEIAYAREHDPRWGLVTGWANQVEDAVERVEAAYDRDPQLIHDSNEQGVYPSEMPQEYFQPEVETYEEPTYEEPTYEQPAYEQPTYEHQNYETTETETTWGTSDDPSSY